MESADLIIFDPTTGEITQNLSIDAESLPAARASGLIFVMGKHTSQTHYILNGLAVPYTPAELEAKASIKPGRMWKMPQRVVIDTRTLGEAKAMKLLEIMRDCEAALTSLTAGYPKAEQQTWDKQEREAREYQVNPFLPTPLLTALAAARGITLKDLAARVIVKADAFAAIAGDVIGKRQRLEDEVDLARTPAQSDAVNLRKPI